MRWENINCFSIEKAEKRALLYEVVLEINNRLSVLLFFLSKFIGI